MYRFIRKLNLVIKIASILLRFSIFMRNIVGYVTNKNRITDHIEK